MQQIKMMIVACLLAIPVLGCGDSKPKPVTVTELTPDQIATQEAALKEADVAERAQRKNRPIEKSVDQLAEESERARRR